MTCGVTLSPLSREALNFLLSVMENVTLKALDEDVKNLGKVSQEIGDFLRAELKELGEEQK